jgi:hypothetical protein
VQQVRRVRLVLLVQKAATLLVLQGYNMAKFPIRYTNATPSGQSTGVTANIDVNTGEEAIGVATAGLGNATYDQGAMVQRQQDAMELSTLDRQTKEIWNAASKTMETTTDDDARKAVYDKAVADINKLQGKNFRTNDAFAQMRNDYMPAFEDEFNKLDRTMRIKSAGDEMAFNYQKAVESGDEATARKIAVTGLNTQLIGKAEYDAKIASLPGDIQLARIRKLADSDPTKALAELETLQGLNNDQLDAKDSIQGIANANLVKNREALKAKQDADMLSIYEASEKGELTYEMVKASSLDSSAKINMWENYKQVQAEKVKSGISQLEEGDPSVLAQVNALIDLRPDAVKPEDVYKLADKGLGTKHIPALITRLEGNKKALDENPVAGKYTSELARLHTAGVFGSLDKRSTSDTYLNLSRKLDAFLKSKPSDVEAQRFFGQLIVEDVRTFGGLWNDNALPGWDDNPLSAEVGESKQAVDIIFGDIVQVDGQYLQAVGRKNGQVEWRTIPKPQ